MLVNMGGPRKTISYSGCMVYYAIFHWLGCTECVILAAMALDYYMAICEALQYNFVMHGLLCQQLMLMAWLWQLPRSGSLDGAVAFLWAAGAKQLLL